MVEQRVTRLRWSEMAGMAGTTKSGSAATEKKGQETEEDEAGCSYKWRSRSFEVGVAWHSYKIASIRMWPHVPVLQRRRDGVASAPR